MAPSEGLSKVLHVGRGSKANDELSRVSTANETTSSDRSGARGSIDRALDKLKDNIRGTGDGSEPGQDSTKLSRIISKTKRKKRKLAIRHADNRPSVPGGPVDTEHGQTLEINPSQESLGLEHSGGSSLLTEDSDVEA